MIYRVWHPADCDEDDARKIEAPSRSEAAQDFAARDDDWAEDETRTYHVRDADGRLWAVAVTCAVVVDFRTREPVRVEEESR